METRTAELRHSQEQLRALAAELTLTEQRERQRFASQLHDHLQQLLVLGKLKLTQAKRAVRSRTPQRVTTRAGRRGGQYCLGLFPVADRRARARPSCGNTGSWPELRGFRNGWST